MAAISPTRASAFTHVSAPVRAMAKTAVFLLKVLPMLPSKPLDRVTPTPVVVRLRYPTCSGEAEGDLYRPETPGPHPGVVVCLGVVPFEVNHPQVPRLGEALARAGFVALMYWSPAMRDFRLDPGDGENIALAYQSLVAQPFVEAERSGLIGTCVGGSFALLAAARPRIRERVGFVAAFAPFSSMWTLAEDIATGSRSVGNDRLAWPVDQLTRKVYLQSLTDVLESHERDALREVFSESGGQLDPDTLSTDGQSIYRLLSAHGVLEVQAALHALPSHLQRRLTAMSPIDHIGQIRTPVITVGHDLDDLVIPVGESQRLNKALSGRYGFHYTEFGMFQHADPTKRRLSPIRILWELGKFYRYVYPVFRHAVSG